MKRLLLLLATLLMFSGCGFDVYKMPLPGGADTGDDPLSLTLVFEDVLDLVPQSTVKVNDVSVGKVTDVRLDGYVAEVDVEIRRDAHVPADAIAKIRQTSLLGEKFVSIEPPPGGGTGRIADGAVLGLDRTGRNPEVEEVLAALSAVLNGGGVAQLKTISEELNAAFEGREGAANSVLHQLRSFMGQLNTHRADIVSAIEALNRLSVSVNSQIGTIDAALEEIPGTLESINRQRDDLVKMLKALDELSKVGVRVITATKQTTIDTFRSLTPVLGSLAQSGSSLVRSLETLPTFPFVDEVVGHDPQVARQLHMGDYANLSVRLDIDVADLITKPPGLPVQECAQIPNLGEVCGALLQSLQNCFQQQTAAACGGLPTNVTSALCKLGPVPGVCPTSTGTSGSPLDLTQLLPRPPVGETAKQGPTYADLGKAYDPDLVAALLMPSAVTS